MSSGHELNVSLTRRVCLGGARQGTQLSSGCVGGGIRRKLDELVIPEISCVHASSFGLCGRLSTEPGVASTSASETG